VYEVDQSDVLTQLLQFYFLVNRFLSYCNSFSLFSWS